DGVDRRAVRRGARRHGEYSGRHHRCIDPRHTAGVSALHHHAGAASIVRAADRRSRSAAHHAVRIGAGSGHAVPSGGPVALPSAKAGAGTMTVLLEARAIDKRFGGLRALTGVSLRMERGQIYGLIGPNGAGKTTFFNCLTGLYRPDGGEFRFDGEPLATDAPHEVARRGIARTFQNIRLFAHMS